jgi:hypothetical protein
VNNELEGIRKEVVMAEFKVVSLCLPGEIEENHKKPKLVSRSVGLNLNLEPLDYEAGVLIRNIVCT